LTWENLLRSENHGERAKLTLHGVERHPERFERQRAEQCAVVFLAEDCGSGALPPVQTKHNTTNFAGDLGAIGQNKRSFRVRLYAQLAKQRGGND
jgi:hypothetical protein